MLKTTKPGTVEKTIKTDVETSDLRENKKEPDNRKDSSKRDRRTLSKTAGSRH
jgi:hypothetical protein